MKRFTSLILAGLLACSLASSGAVAQTADDSEPAVPVTAGEPAGDVVPFSEEPSLLYATELMQRAEVYAETIAEVSDVSEVEVLQVSALPRVEASPPIFADTMNRFITYYGDSISMLRDALADNPVVAEALQAEGIDVSDIVAAEIRPDLALRVYVRDW